MELHIKATWAEGLAQALEHTPSTKPWIQIPVLSKETEIKWKASANPQTQLWEWWESLQNRRKIFTSYLLDRILNNEE
jgi:hypothetical protein